MYTPSARRRGPQYARRRSRRRSIVPDLPLQPPATTPAPVFVRPAVLTAWQAELASTMAALHPLVSDDQAPTEPTRPLRNAARGSNPPRPSSEPAAPPPLEPLEALEPPEPVEPVVDLRPRSARAGAALVAVATVAVLVGVAIAFFVHDVKVDVEPELAQPKAVDAPAPVVTALPVEGSHAGGAVESEPKPRARPTPERTRTIEPALFVERVVEEPGYFTVDAHPYATVYIDSERAGDTPLIRHALSGGKHRVKLVSSDGSTKRFIIRIEPGTTLRRRE